MFAYISLTLGDSPRLSSFYISSKVLLGLSGVVLVMLSVLGSVGFFSVIGVKSTLIIMEVIPFLVLAVEVVEVGPSITLASLSEVLAFALRSFIPMSACRVFSMFAGLFSKISLAHSSAALAVLLDFLLQVTVFVALIVFDFWRTEDKRVDCYPCMKISSYTNSDKGIDQKNPGLLTRYMKALCTRIQPGLEQKIVLPQDSYLQVCKSGLEQFSFFNFAVSAFVTQMFKMTVPLPYSLKKNSHGSSMLYPLMIVLKAAMELTLAVWTGTVEL
ncbi:hypothetical protein C1H46_006769 [Malus baccata]|uniref:SSD domain-containing protein n=1 Tax=Malus baccata TaxID=106549 RepID=A0A540N9A4_MALBA|nr:hypothetical protein C1H46_006769 [Malus baccata]